MAKMAYPTFSTRRTNRGFTLAEIMIGAAIGSFVLAGVLSTYLMIGRSVANAANYSMLEAASNKGLEVFSRETRMAVSVTSASGTSVTLGIPDTTSSTTAAYTVTYAYNSVAKTFTRTIASGV